MTTKAAIALCVCNPMGYVVGIAGRRLKAEAPNCLVKPPKHPILLPMKSLSVDGKDGCLTSILNPKPGK